MRKPSVHSGKWKSNEGIDNIANGHVNNMSVLLYVIKWQMICFQALWKTKSFVKVCLKFKLPLWTKGLLIHLSPLWQLPLWHFPRWHNFPVYICDWNSFSNIICPIHKSDKCFLFLAHYWRSHCCIRPRHLILAINMWIIIEEHLLYGILFSMHAANE